MDQTIASQVEEWRRNNQDRLIKCEVQHCNFITLDACIGRQKSGGMVVIEDGEDAAGGSSLMEAAYVSCRGCTNWQGFERPRRYKGGVSASMRPKYALGKSVESYTAYKEEVEAKPTKLADYIDAYSPSYGEE